MDIAIPIFDGITALDAIGPYEVLSRLPGARTRFVAIAPGTYRTDNGQLALVADESLAAVSHPEIVLVPGGFGTRALMTEPRMLDWLRVAHATSEVIVTEQARALGFTSINYDLIYGLPLQTLESIEQTLAAASRRSGRS